MSKMQRRDFHCMRDLYNKGIRLVFLERAASYWYRNLQKLCQACCHDPRGTNVDFILKGVSTRYLMALARRTNQRLAFRQSEKGSGSTQRTRGDWSNKLNGNRLMRKRRPLDLKLEKSKRPKREAYSFVGPSAPERWMIRVYGNWLRLARIPNISTKQIRKEMADKGKSVKRFEMEK